MLKKTFRLQLTPKVAECISHRDTSLQDVVFALCQDSVCSRASQVALSTSTIDGKTWLSVTDDGEEIFENELAIGKTKKASKNIYVIKMSRQLSIWKLWHRGAVVESKRLSLTLVPENFPINRDVQMQSSPVERGTKISLPMLAGEITELLRVIKCIATYSPISIIFNGSKFKDNRTSTQVTEKALVQV